MHWIKAWHVVFMVTWFAGLFYLPRLFVYHAATSDSAGVERFRAMERRLFAIMTIGAALLVFTVITVGANYLHLTVAPAITLALIIASIKASMVAAVFMHLNHEKQWIYGALILTVAFFIVLIFVPLLTTMDTFGTHLAGPAHGATAGAAGEHAGH